MKSLVLATANVGKLQEFANLLSPLGWQVKPQSSWGVPNCAEPHLTFVENALAKARCAALHTGLAALADDSGLCVKALSNAPGVRSARYACEQEGDSKNDAANNIKLLHQMSGFDAKHQRQAYFICALVAVQSATDPEPLIAIGRWHGNIALQASGSNGFGYDPLFVCSLTNLSAASMSEAQKAILSHRSLAVSQMLTLIKTNW